jgi:hypothetical protein
MKQGLYEQLINKLTKDQLIFLPIELFRNFGGLTEM